MNPILQIASDNKAGKGIGIYSCCSANEYVLRAAMKKAMEKNTWLLIESTANQVDQNGGYTGMKPVDFYAYVQNMARENGFPMEKLILGGDHLGPLSWQDLPESEAMKNANELVKQYVLAGFTKIHLDTSMRVADDDPNIRLSDETIAARGARLCRIAENAYAERKKQDPEAIAPVYVIGSEVPIPGGAQEKEEGVEVTRPEDCLATVESFRKAFQKEGLEDAWQRVCALVVQPGVEFGDSDVFYYDSEKAKELTAVLPKLGNLVFEGHSTDYQTPECLRNMVQDGIAILKVGPGLTFGLREALFALDMMEQELIPTGKRSNFRKVLDQIMMEDPKYWRKYYHGNEEEQAFARAFSYSDRARYYLPQKPVMEAIARLEQNLGEDTIPDSLLSQYMPLQYKRVCAGKIGKDAKSLILDRIGDYIDDYLYAVL